MDFDPDRFLAGDDFDPDEFLNDKPKALPKVDLGPAAIMKAAQGGSLGSLDELSGVIEGLGSIAGIKGAGGPFKDIEWSGDTRTYAQARDEGMKRKRELLEAAQDQHPVTSTIAELGGGIASGIAGPLKAASAAGRIAGPALLGGVAGANYADGGLEDRAEGALTGTLIGGALPGAIELAKGVKTIGPQIGRVLTTMPEQQIQRYIDRGHLMDKTDSLVKVAEDIPRDLGKLMGQVQKESGESRQILQNEGVKIPTTDIMNRIKTLLQSTNQDNTSAAPVLGKLRSFFDKYTPKPGSVSEIMVDGTAQQAVPTSSRVVTGPSSQVPVRKSDDYLRGVPISEARGTTPPAVKPAQVQNITGARIETVPTQTRQILTKPGYKPPTEIEGGDVKSMVQDAGELLDKLKSESPAFRKSEGGKLANQAYFSLQEPLKQASPAYAEKMGEIAQKMQVLENARKRFPTAEKTLSKLRRIGADKENAVYMGRALDDASELLGGSYKDRIKDQMTLDAFTKPGVQGSRSVNTGRGFGGVFGPVGEAVGAALGGTTDYYGRQAMKLSIDLSRKLPSLPVKYQRVLSDAIDKGGNSLAITHHLLLANDPGYRDALQNSEESE